MAFKSLIEIKDRYGDILFRNKCSKNTYQETIFEAFRQGVELKNADLSNLDLTHVNFYGINLSGSNFSHSNLTGADFSKCNLSNSDLTKAICNNANFFACEITKAEFYLAQCIRADFSSAICVGTSWRKTNLKSSNLSQSSQYRADFSEANLESVELYNADMMECNLSRTINIPEHYLLSCSKDLLYIFSHLDKHLEEIKNLILTHQGDNFCLFELLIKECQKNKKPLPPIPFYIQGLHNPGEQFLWQIKGLNDQTSQFFINNVLQIIKMLEK